MAKTVSTWQPGQVTNPKGGVRRLSVAQLARNHVPRVIERLVYWLEQDDTPSASIRAGEIILERAYGKAVQPVADGSNHEALEVDLTGYSAKELAALERSMSKLLTRTTQMQDAVIDLQATEPALATAAPSNDPS